MSLQQARFTLTALEADESGTAPADWLCHSAVWLVSTLTVAQNIAVVPKLLGWSRAKIQPALMNC